MDSALCSTPQKIFEKPGSWLGANDFAHRWVSKPKMDSVLCSTSLIFQKPGSRLVADDRFCGMVGSLWGAADSCDVRTFAFWGTSQGFWGTTQQSRLRISSSAAPAPTIENQNKYLSSTTLLTNGSRVAVLDGLTETVFEIKR